MTAVMSNAASSMGSSLSCKSAYITSDYMSVGTSSVTSHRAGPTTSDNKDIDDIDVVLIAELNS